MLFQGNSSAAFFANVTPLFTPLFIASTHGRNIACGMAGSKSARIPPDCIILDR